MKKILLSLLAICGILSCSKNQGPDVWKSEAYDYAGRFMFQVLEEGNAKPVIPFGSHEMRIFNSAANKANEIWLDDHSHKIPLKSLFVISGTAKDFKSAGTGYDAQTDNLYMLEAPGKAEKVDAPTAAGLKVSVDRESVRAEILEARIEPKAYETPGKNKADKLYVKVRLYEGKVHFESVEKPKDEWEKPNVPEFKWVFKYSEDLKKHADYIILGHRFTGFNEDVY